MTMKADLVSDYALAAVLIISGISVSRSLERLVAALEAAGELAFRMVVGLLTFRGRRISRQTAGGLAWAVLILIAPSMVRGQNPKSDLEELDLTGRVRQVRESVEYQASEGKPNWVDMVYTFSPDGKLRVCCI